MSWWPLVRTPSNDVFPELSDMRTTFAGIGLSSVADAAMHDLVVAFNANEFH